MVVREQVLISFRALDDCLPVALVTGTVAKICSNVSIIEYVPSCLAALKAWTAIGRLSGPIGFLSHQLGFKAFEAFRDKAFVLLKCGSQVAYTSVDNISRKVAANAINSRRMHSESLAELL